MNHKLSSYSTDYALTRSPVCAESASMDSPHTHTHNCQTSVIRALISSALQQQQTNPMKKNSCIAGGSRALAFVGGSAGGDCISRNAISAEHKQTQVISIQIFIEPQDLDHLKDIIMAVSLSGLCCLEDMIISQNLYCVMIFLSFGVIWFLNCWQFHSWMA